MKFKKSVQPFSSLRSFYSYIQIFILVFCLLTSALVSSASASYINFTTTLTSKVEGNDLNVSVTSINKGDESAFNVQAELLVGEQKIAAEKVNELRVGGTYKIENKIKLTDKKQGLYPLILIIHYTDANQYPFTALSCQTYEYGKKSVSPVLGQIKPTQISKKGNVILAIKNTGDTPIKAKTYLVVPGELTIEDREKEIKLPARSEKEVKFAVRNFSALVGSTYQLFAITEFDTKDEHQTFISSGTIQVVVGREILGMNYIIIIAVLILLISIVIIVQFKRK
jgi:hypothetical protein